MKDKNMSWFGVLITPSPEDASAPLLSVDKKPYRELILANNISVFDFRIYVLARQCEILAKMGRINEICSKSAAFLEVFGRGLREVEVTLNLLLRTLFDHPPGHFASLLHRVLEVFLCIERGRSLQHLYIHQSYSKG